MSAFKIIIKRTSDSSSTEVEISADISTVAKLLDRVRSKIGIEGNKFMRLIHKGKLLEPPEADLCSFNLQEGSFVHLVVTDHDPRASAPTSRSDSFRARNSTGGINDGNELSSRGLGDLMSTHGLDEGDIAALRSTFSNDIEEFRISSRIERDPRHETEGEYRMRLESEWMRSLDRRRSVFWRNLPSPSGYLERSLVDRFQRLEYSMNNMEEGQPDSSSSEVSAQSFLGTLLGTRPYAPLRGSETNEAEEEDAGTEMTNMPHRNHAHSEGDNGNRRGISATTPASMDREVPPQYQLGTYKDCFLGMLLGSLFGTLMLLCVFDGNRGHRYKVGVLLGVCLQLLLSIYDKTHPTDTDHQVS